MKKTLGIALLLTLTALASAQNLPTMEKDKNVNVGKLANGVEYYLVKNASELGYADMALVQKGRVADGSEREALCSLPHFYDMKPYEFLSRNGVAYEPYGYMYDGGSGLVFRFNSVPMYDSYAADSTLMLAFDLVNTYPNEQAIVISGDIDVTKIQERMKVLSMMVPQRMKSPASAPYEWKPTGLVESVSTNNSVNLSEIKVVFSAPRTEKALLNTPQPLVTKMFANEFGYIATGRIRRTFALAGLPLCAADFRYFDAASSNGDEKYEISLKVDADNVGEAVGVLATVLARMDADGVTAEEFAEAKEVMMARSFIKAGDTRISNEEYVEKCVSAYLYGTSLTTLSAARKFFVHRQLDPARELEFFNNFISALISSDENISLVSTYPYGMTAPDALAGAFKSKWQAAISSQDAAVSMMPADTAAIKRNLKKTKLKSEVSEPLTGGKMWTFANGIKVIYKKMDTGGILYYGLVLKGGAAEIPDLDAGESAFLADMPFAGRIAGLDAESFRRVLAIRGIDLGGEVTLSDVRFRGTAPSGELQHLLEAIYAIGYSRKADAALFSQYRASEVLRIEDLSLTNEGAKSAIDSRLRPDYYYSMHKDAANLGGDLPAKAARFFDERFAKFNDGVFIIIGDLPEAGVKAALEKTMGSFAVNSRHSSRAKSGDGFKEVWYSQSVSGPKAVDVGIAVSPDLSIKQFVAYRIALLALRNDLLRRFADAGQTLRQDVNYNFIYLHMEDCDPSGLPSDVTTVSSLKSIDRVRSSITRMAAKPMDKSLLEKYKSAILSTISSEAADPEALLYYAITRYAGGRDLLTGYKEAVKAVTVADVQNILKTIDSAPRIEFISTPSGLK